MNTWKKSALCSAAASAFVVGGLAVVPVSAAPPEPSTFEDVWACPDFAVDVTASGRTKDIEVPGTGDTITIAPNTTVTLTNQESGTTQSIKANGTFRVTLDDRGTEDEADDNLVIQARGRNVLFLPGIDGEREPRIFLTSGNVTFVLNATTFAEVEPFSGPGNARDLCPSLV